MACMTDSHISLLPPELKLKILSYVDSQTLRISVPLINKDFYKLSKDFSFYERYKTQDFDKKTLKTRSELNYSLYREHLRSLTTTADCLNKIELDSFTKLENLDVYIPEKHWQLINIPKNVNSIKVRGRLSSTNFEENIIPLLREVETVYIDDEEQIENLLQIPANLYLIDADIFSAEEIINRLKSGDLSEILETRNIAVRIDCYTATIARDNVLSYLASNVAKISVSLQSRPGLDRNTLIAICMDCTTLEHLELSLHHINNIPQIQQVSSDNLQTLHLNVDDDGLRGPVVIKRCQLLIRAAKRELFLKGLIGIPFGLFEILSDTLESLSLFNCEWLQNNAGHCSLKSIKHLTVGCNILLQTFAQTINMFGSTVTKLELEYPACDVLLRRLAEFKVLVDFSMANTLHPALRPTTDFVFSLIETLLISRETLRVLKYHSRDKPKRKLREILELLQTFCRLQYFEIGISLKFDREDVTELFPTAIMKDYYMESGHGIVLFT